MPDRTLSRRPVLDPAVADLLTGMEQKQADASLPRKQRERKARERAKIQSRREQRATYDLPPVLRQQIKDLAETERLPASQLVTFALALFLQQLSVGAIDLNQYKRPSRSPRYDWNLELPADLAPAAPTRRKSKTTEK
jgi:hypothetical protein